MCVTCVCVQVCPHLPWEWMFYLFGVGGLVWLLAWLSLYSEKRSTSDLEEEFIEPPKVGYKFFFFQYCFIQMQREILSWKCTS